MIRFFEELSMNAWPALQTELYDGWVMRFADGYTKRSNSINPIYPSTLDPEEKITVCESKYGAWNMPVIFKLTADPFAAGLDRLLEQKGYGRIDETSFRILDLGNFNKPVPGGVKVDAGINDEWLDNFFRITENNDAKVRTTAGRLLGNIRNEILAVTKVVDGRIVASGLGVIERGFTGIFDVIVEKASRGRGYGRDILEGILSSAKKRGSKTSYLQVVAGNTVAENLYGKLGYHELYRYWYRVRRA